MDAPTDAGPTQGATPRPPDPPGWPGPRRLRRRPDDGHIAGVCAGVAEYFNVDPVIVRIAAVVLLFSGPGFFAYVLAWIFVPEERGPVPYGAPQAPIDRKDRGTQIFGIVLLALAISVIWGDWWSPARRWLFPLGLMALGAWLLLRRDHGDDPVPGVPVPPVPPVPGAAPWSAGPPEAHTTVAEDDPSAATAEVEGGEDPTAVAEPGDGGAGFGPPTAPWDVLPPPVPPIPPLPSMPPAGPRRRRILGPVVFGALLMWAGLASLTDVSLETGLAGGLLILGIGFVLGSFVGGSRALILPALVVAAALVVTTVVDIPLSGPIGSQQWAPQRVSDVEDRYEVSIGEGTLDLSAIDVRAGDELEIEATVGLGHLIILVPDALDLDVTTEIGAGESDVLGFKQDGIGVSTDRHDDGDDGHGGVVLDLQVGMGQIEVRRVDGSAAPDPVLR